MQIGESAAGTGHLEPEHYPMANGTQCKGNAERILAKVNGVGPQVSFSAGSLARVSRASAEVILPRRFRFHSHSPTYGLRSSVEGRVVNRFGH